MFRKMIYMKKDVCIRVFADPVQIRKCKLLLNKSQAVFLQLSDILALAGNESRLKILFLLEEENELCPCDLADILDMTVPAVSQHLRKLKDAGIIQSRREGQTIYYSLSDENLKILKPFFRHITQSIKHEAL